MSNDEKDVRAAAIARVRNEAQGRDHEPMTISRDEAVGRARGEVLLPDDGRATSYDEDKAQARAMVARAEREVRAERAERGRSTADASAVQGRTRDSDHWWVDNRNIRVTGSRGRDYPDVTRGDRGRQR